MPPTATPPLYDSLAHVQLAALPISSASAAIICTSHSPTPWMNTDPEYDITVVPFFEKVQGNGYAALHRPGSYYESNTYPVKAIKAAGGILTTGSGRPRGHQ